MLPPEFTSALQRLTEIVRRSKAAKTLSAADQAFIARIIEAAAPVAVGRPRSDSSGKLPIYSAMADCAGATGIPLALLKQAKKAGCPAFKWNRVDLGEFLKWAFSPDRDGIDDVDWSNELRKWMAKRQKIAHDRDAKLVMDMNQARDDINLGMGVLFGELDRVFTVELPAALKGQNESAIRDRSVTEIERIKEIARGKFLQTAGAS